MGRLPADLGERGDADQRADQPDRRLSGDRATGTLSTAIGLTVAFALLVGTIHLAARLQRTALVSAAATEAAHRVAVGLPEDDAEARIRRLLGPGAAIRWSTDGAGVRVDVTVDSPTVPGLPARIQRGATARWERLR